jgi:magnesium chelatase family protein
MDIRVPLKPVPFRDMMGRRGETSRTVRERVKRAVDSQADRYRHQSWAWNSRIPAGRIEEFCALDSECIRVFASAVDKLSLSSRACHSIVKLARTISDLKGREKISKDHVLEAVQHRRYGEQDPFWNCG